ncbi:MAG: cysteine desulfurase family protein [Candidatus Paceibacterota bacterium]
MFTKKKIYLDNASATPLDKRVLKVMSLYNRDFFANATSIHSNGVKVREIIEKSRESITKGINAHSNEIIFTGSSTESNALAILGLINNYQLTIINLNTNIKLKIPHIITSEIEHPAVLENCKLLESEGRAEVTYIKVNNDGIINPKDVKEAMKENTVLVSIMYANNEIGTIQPIEEIAKEIRHYKKMRSAPQGLASGSLEARPFPAVFPLFHTDATQAMNYLDTSNVEKLGVDMMSFNGSKIYGPKGIGVLYKKRGVELASIYAGGGQEFGLRSGTENVASIAGLALALEITNEIKNKEKERLTKLRNYAIEKLLNINIGNFKIILNGSREVRLPNNINISISGIASELLVIELDAKGIEVSSRSACKSGEDNAHTLRITLSRQTTKKDMDKFVNVLVKILEKYKKWK